MRSVPNAPLPSPCSEHAAVLQELIRREPLFHRPEFGTTRNDSEQMTSAAFREVSASGRRFSREFVLDTLEERYKHPTHDVWEVGASTAWKSLPKISSSATLDRKRAAHPALHNL